MTWPPMDGLGAMLRSTLGKNLPNTPALIRIPIQSGSIFKFKVVPKCLLTRSQTVESMAL